MSVPSLQGEVQAPAAPVVHLGAMAMPNQSRPGLAAGLKRRLELDVEHIEERHQAILTDVEAAFESAGIGVSWLKQCVSEEVKHVKRGHEEIMTRLEAITAVIDAEITDGAGEAILHRNQPCVRETSEDMGHSRGKYDGFCCGRCRDPWHSGHGPACERIENFFVVVATTVTPTEAGESRPP